MAGSVTDRDYGFAALLEALGAVADAPGVLVGIAGAQDSEMVVIAASNEFGTDRIPERSFLRSTIDDNEQQIADDLEAAVDAILGGDDPERALGLVGEKWVGEIKKRITDRIPPPNAPSTIARKGSDMPLVDTGRLRNSIDWQLE